MASKRVIVSVLKRLVEKKAEELAKTRDERVLVRLQDKAQEILDARPAVGKRSTVGEELDGLAEQFDYHLTRVQMIPEIVRKAIFHNRINTKNPFREPGAVRLLVPPSPAYSSSSYEYYRILEKEDEQTIKDLKLKVETAELKLAFGADLDKVKEILVDLGFDPKDVGL